MNALPATETFVKLLLSSQINKKMGGAVYGSPWPTRICPGIWMHGLRESMHE
jgi:hypothetical protein